MFPSQKKVHRKLQTNEEKIIIGKIRFCPYSFICHRAYKLNFVMVNWTNANERICLHVFDCIFDDDDFLKREAI